MVVNPRLNDWFNLNFSQANVDFAVPHLREDLPLNIDPFLLWSSAKSDYLSLHGQLLDYFRQIQEQALKGQEAAAIQALLSTEEPREIGLGYAAGHKRGLAIGPKLARDIVTLFKAIPQLGSQSLSHIEEIQLLVPGIGEDRISDLTASILKSYLIDFTSQRAIDWEIPVKRYNLPGVYDPARHLWAAKRNCELPYNPMDLSPILLVPLDWLRHLPWINYEDYYRSFYAPYVLPPNSPGRRASKELVLAYNRANYQAVERYVAERERAGSTCSPSPLFQPLGVETVRKKFKTIQSLSTGIDDDNDQKYEELVYDILSSLLYPEMIFAARQSRTVTNVHVRDLIFYNDGSTAFCNDIRARFQARQIVFELKNVKKLDREHVNQLFRYLGDEFGCFGILMTRNVAPTSVLKNTVDLHSAKRCVILCLDDSDIELMINLAESGRRPLEAIKKKFVEFTRLLPS